MTELKLAPSLLLDLWSAAVRTEELIDRAVRGTAMPADNFALHSLIGAHGPLTPTEIAERTRVPLSTVVFRARKLIAAGYVQRARNPDDGRSYLLSLTSEGRRVLDQALPAFGAALRSMQSRLQMPPSDVQAALRDLVDALSAELESPDEIIETAGRDL